MSTLGTRLHGLQDRAEDALAEMNQRDRTLLIALIIAVVIAILGGGTWWMNSTIRGLNSRLESRQETLHTIKVMAEDHADNLVQAKQIEEQLAKHKGTDLSSFLEKTAKEAGITDKLKSVREKSVNNDGVLEEKLYSVALTHLSLNELTAFLYSAETAGYPLQVRNFKAALKKKGDTRYLNVDLDISAYRVIETEEGGEG